MVKKVTFWLDTKGGADILQNMAMPTVKKSAEAIAGRGRTISSSLTSKSSPDIGVTTQVGTIRRGRRAIATVRAVGKNARENYIGHQALSKAKDAGRIT